MGDWGLGEANWFSDGVFVPRNDGGTTGRWWEFLSREGVEKMAARVRNWVCMIAPKQDNIRTIVLVCQGGKQISEFLKNSEILLKAEKVWGLGCIIVMKQELLGGFYRLSGKNGLAYRLAIEKNMGLVFA